MKLLVKPQNGNHSKPPKISSMYKQWAMLSAHLASANCCSSLPLLSSESHIVHILQMV